MILCQSMKRSAWNGLSRSRNKGMEGKSAARSLASRRGCRAGVFRIAFRHYKLDAAVARTYIRLDAARGVFDYFLDIITIHFDLAQAVRRGVTRPG